MPGTVTPAGRPEIGQPINIRLGDELLAQVDKMALAYGWSRAMAIRHLVAMGIDAERKARVPGGNPAGSGPNPPSDDDGVRRIEAVQTAVVSAINTLGEILVGPEFTPITSSPIPDDEVARILAWTVDQPEQIRAGFDFTVHRDPPFYDTENCPRCSHNSHMDDRPCGCERGAVGGG